MIPAGLRRWLGGARPGIKICGLTCEEDAHAAIAAGADALGFNFFPKSKRAVRLAEVAPWITRLPEDIGRVAVVVNPDEALLIALRDSALFHAIQFHGGESPEFCAQWGGDFYLKACPLSDLASAEAALSDLASAEAALADPAPCLLLDAHAPGVYGGTGQTIDWTLAAQVVARAGRPVVLSGGLNPTNVATALHQVRPAAVDTASGVESSPGRKDPDKIRSFVTACQRSYSNP